MIINIILFQTKMVDNDNHEDLLDYLKLDPDHHEKIAALIPKETWYEQLIRYGLYIGAVFQMVCILVSLSHFCKSILIVNTSRL